MYICTNYSYMLMKKRLLLYTFSMAMMLAVPTVVMAGIPVAPGIEQVGEDEVTITVEGSSVIVSGAQGETLEVVSLTGRRVMTVKIESPAQRIELNVPKGCYLLKVGKGVRKVSIR